MTRDSPQPSHLSFGQESLIRLLASGAKRGDACRGAGIARGTFYRWLQENPAFRAAVAEAEGRHAPLWRPVKAPPPPAEDAVPAIIVVPTWAAILLAALAISSVFTFLLAPAGS